MFNHACGVADRRGDPGVPHGGEGNSVHAERADVISILAETPRVGVALGGGIRKMRIARSGRGKSSGARVVLLFAGDDVPVFLLTVFAKNEKANLGTRERTALIAVAKQMVDDYRKRK